MFFQNEIQGFYFQVETVALCEFELRQKSPLAPEFGPVAAPAVCLWGGADGVVAPLAKARPVVAMRRGEHFSQGRKIAIRLQLHELH